MVKEFWENGKIKMEYEVNELGEKHGMYRSYTQNGTLFVEGKFVNGKREGVWKQLNSDTTVREVMYVDGKKVK